MAAPAEVELSDEFAKGFGLENLAALKEKIRENIERDHLAASRGKWKRELLDALDKKFAFDVPEGMVAQEFAAVWRTVEAEQKRSGRSFEDENTTEEAARADYLKIAERRVRLGLLLAEIGQKADIKVSDEEVGQALTQRARAFPGQEKAVWDYYRKNPNALAEIRAPLYEEKVVDYVISLVNLTDKKVPKEELLRAQDDVKTKSPARVRRHDSEAPRSRGGGCSPSRRVACYLCRQGGIMIFLPFGQIYIHQGSLRHA